MLGSIATAAAFVRMAVFIQTGIPSEAMNRTTVMGLPTYDVLGIVSAEVFWTMIECTVALIAVCLPAIRKAVARSTVGRALGLATLSRVLRSMGSSKGTRKDDSAVSKDNYRPSSECGKIDFVHVVEVSYAKVQNASWLLTFDYRLRRRSCEELDRRDVDLWETQRLLLMFRTNGSDTLIS